jgi:hypothetical protein
MNIFSMAPKEAWKVSRGIEKGFTGHLPNITPTQFAKSDGLNATSDDENADILKNHFQAVYDRRDATTYETVIDYIEELDTDGDLKEDLRSIPEIEEFKQAINRMRRETAPGVMGITADMLKGRSEKSLEHLTLIIQKFWKGEEDHKVWHTMILAALFKGKVKTNDPDNYRGVCLKELTSKVISSIVSTRLSAVLSGNNVEEQFTTIGCQQAMQSLRSELSIRRAHNMDT